MRQVQLVLILLSLALLILACENPVQTGKPYGRVILSVPTIGLRTIQPLNSGITGYRATGTGSGSDVLAPLTSASGSFSLNLAPGSWKITIDGLDGSGTVVASGSTTIGITSGSVTSASVELLPVTGTGTLSLSVSWPLETKVTEVSGTLTPEAGGEAKTINLTLSGSTASYTGTQSDGAYILVVNVLSGTLPIAAPRAELVKIYKGQTSIGNFPLARGDFVRTPVKVTFESNGGSALAALNTSKVETVPVSIQAGKALVGWYTDPTLSHSSKITFPYLPSADVQLYAGWTPSTPGLQFSANATGYTVNPGSFTGGDLLIPAFWLGKPVTAIGSFYAMRDITSVSIPATVTSIENYAFTYCPVGVSVDPASSSFKAIEGVLFDKAGTTLVYFPGHTTAAYVIPAGVTTIAQGAFMTADVPGITFPSSLTTIHDQAFFDCSNLKNLSLPSSLNGVGYEAFRGCNNLNWIQVDAVVPPAAQKNLFFQSGKFTDIRVPDASVTAYQAAAGWSDYATLVTAQSTAQMTSVVSFNSNGGSTVPALGGVANGSTISRPSDPTKSGNTFAGWYKDAGLTTVWAFGSDTVAADTMLYAKWTTAVGTGGITVNPPVIVTISFTQTPPTSLAPGTDLTITAQPSSAVDSYAWYLDGAAVSGQSAATITTGASLAAGVHNLTSVVKKNGTLFSNGFTFTVQ